MIRTINKLTGSLRRRVRLMVGRGVLALVNDAAKMQSVQVELLDGEVRDMERFQNYGYSSQPHSGAEVAAVFVGGNRDHGLVLAIDDRRYRITSLQPGEVAIYTDEGDSIILKRGRLVAVTTKTLQIDASAQVVMNTPLLQINGGDVKADGISLKHHKNSNVQPGSGVSGEAVA